MNKKPTKDLYKILGINKDATAKEIKGAYRKRANETHPDKQGDESAEEFKEVSMAYLVLSNPDKRKRYDDGDDPENLHAEQDHVTQKLAQLFIQTLSSVDTKHQDVFLTMRSTLTKEKHKGLSAIRVGRSQIAQFTKDIKRVKKKKGKDNFFVGLIEGTIGMVKRDIEKITEAIGVVDRCLAKIDEYEWVVDKRPETNLHAGMLDDLRTRFGPFGSGPFGGTTGG